MQITRISVLRKFDKVPVCHEQKLPHTRRMIAIKPCDFFTNYLLLLCSIRMNSYFLYGQKLVLMSRIKLIIISKLLLKYKHVQITKS